MCWKEPDQHLISDTKNIFLNKEISLRKIRVVTIEDLPENTAKIVSSYILKSKQYGYNAKAAIR